MTLRTWLPHVTVACIVPRHNSYLLVEEEIGGKSVLNQPAGHLESGESLQQAALRETLEETAWRVELRSLVGIYLWPRSKEESFLRFCFLADAEKQLPNKIDPAIKATHWLDYDAILQQKDSLRSPLVLKCIEDYRSGQSYPLELAQYLE